MRIALRTQQVIAHETGVVNAVDPLGGSYHVEQLTNVLEAQAYAYFEQIEERGGMVAAIRQNFPQAEIAEASFRYQSEVEARQRLIVGVNAHTVGQETPIPLHKIDPALEPRQVERVRALRAQRDAFAAERTLAELRETAAGTANLMPAIIRAAQADVTMGEMCDVLRDVWGIWRETPVY